MIGSNGPRMLAATLEHADAWNTWYADYGNTPEGLAELIERIGIPETVTRSVCALCGADGPEERDGAGAARRRRPRRRPHP